MKTSAVTINTLTKRIKELITRKKLTLLKNYTNIHRSSNIQLNCVYLMIAEYSVLCSSCSTSYSNNFQL